MHKVMKYIGRADIKWEQVPEVAADRTREGADHVFDEEGTIKYQID